MHLDEGAIQRLLDGEMTGRRAMAARLHVESCEVCRGRLARSERDEARLRDLLPLVDDAPPPLEAADVMAETPQAGSPWARWAAVVLVAAAIAGGAYAFPGSPLRTWVGALGDWVGDVVEGRFGLVRGGPGSEPPETGGLSVEPGPSRLIRFDAYQVAGRVRVSLVDGSELVIRAPVGAARYTSETNRILIDNTASVASFEIEVPRFASRVEVQIAERRVFLKEAGHIDSEVPSAGGAYEYSLQSPFGPHPSPAVGY